MLIPTVFLLQAVQSEVDSATQTACDLRQRMVEKDVALELTACHLRQQEAARSTLQEAITAALALLHQAAFQVCSKQMRLSSLLPVFPCCLEEYPYYLSNTYLSPYNKTVEGDDRTHIRPTNPMLLES